MDKIRQLDAFEALKIAAGEVVERPADILKELVENSIDAGARSISIYSHGAGQTLLRVVDDGSGMSYRDAHACIKRHATSKITSIEDLSTLRSFGFRGEGLASIAAVAKLELVTKTAEASLATSLFFEQSICLQEQEIAAGTGTDISVRDLFYALPARKKFLRKEETEWRLLQQLFQAFCLSHLSIHFKLFAENKLVYNCPPAATVVERCQQLWEASLGAQLAPVETTQSKITLHGVISTPTIQRYNRQQIFIFVNQRWIKNAKLSQALLKGYAGSLPPERYPIAVLLLTIPPHEVDINVHPRKEEVTFLYPRLIEQTITTAVHAALQTHVQRQLKEPSLPSTSPLTNFVRAHSHEGLIPPTAPFFLKNLSLSPSSGVPQSFPTAPLSTSKPAPFMPEPLPVQQLTLPSTQPTTLTSYQVLGVLHDTYILLEHADGLLLIDQHAAHERILYELFAHRFESASAIELLFKPTLSLPSADLILLNAYQELFKQYHILFESIEDVGIRINAVPLHLKQIDWQDFFAHILVSFKQECDSSPHELTQRLHHALRAQMACKAAVKAGDTLSTLEINRLLEDLSKCPDRLSCPHGRPISWLLPKSEILKQFRRTS
jgi:DNA mismatch repair protein MutL